MPAQTTAAETVFYVENDTSPDLELFVRDSAGALVDLTGTTVKLYIAWASWSHYYSPWGRIVDGATMTVDPDQVTNKGRVSWTPGEGDLSPAGSFHYRIEITYGDGTKGRFPKNTQLPMVIRAQVGGTP